MNSFHGSLAVVAVVAVIADVVITASSVAIAMIC